MKHNTVSILMPAYNEGGYIYQSVKLLSEFIETQPLEYEVIILDDGSWDNTAIEAQRACQDFKNIRYLSHKKNKGKGAALKSAFLISKGDIIIFLDADLDLPPSQLSLFFSTLNSGKSDVIIGCKRHPDSMVDYPLDRKIISVGYSLFLRLLFGLPLKDSQTGMKLFKREVLNKIFPIILCKRFAYDIEILACAHKYGFKIQEIPIIIRYNRNKWGHIGLKSIYLIALDTLAIAYRMYIRKWYQRRNSPITHSLPGPVAEGRSPSSVLTSFRSRDGASPSAPPAHNPYLREN